MNCQNRAEGISIIEWCSRYGITKVNYYYRLRRVKEAGLNQFLVEAAGHTRIVRVLFFQENNSPVAPECGFELSINGNCIYVTESFSMKLLSDVLEVVHNAQRRGLAPMKYLKYILSDMPGSAFFEHPEYLDDHLPWNPIVQ